MQEGPAELEWYETGARGLGFDLPGAQLAALETRYNAQMMELREASRVITDNYREKLRALEREVKRLEAHNHELSHGRSGAGLQAEKKINELLENERRLQEELQALRASEERLAIKYQRENERDKEALRRKLVELDGRLKRAESERSGAAFEAEKARTKWEIEKEHLLALKADSQEALQHTQRAKDELMRENERLRGELRGLKRAQAAPGVFAKSRAESSGDKSAFITSPSMALLNQSQTASAPFLPKFEPFLLDRLSR